MIEMNAMCITLYVNNLRSTMVFTDELPEEVGSGEFSRVKASRV